MCNNFIRRFDLTFKPVMILPLLTIIAAIPAAILLPVQYAGENHFIENAQLFISFGMFMLCINSRVDKRLFNSVAFACLIIFLMEINSGVMLYKAISESQISFLLNYMKDVSQVDFENIYYSIIAFGCFIYAIFTKAFMMLPDYIFKSKISFYNICFLIIGVIFLFAGITGEFAVFRKMAETILYFTFMSIIYLQTQDDEYIEAIKN